MIFNYSYIKNNKKLFVENVMKLSQHIAVSGSIRHYAPPVVYVVRTRTALAFEALVNTENNYKGGYDEPELREYLYKSKKINPKST